MWTIREGWLVRSIFLRKFPYPYRAALTLANDIDLTSWDAFIDIYRFLGSTGDTPLGDGLGIPLSSSFFLYPDPSGKTFSYFSSFEAEDGPHCKHCDTLIRLGFFDTIHGFGASFPEESPFVRAFAEKAYSILEERELRCPIWSNHGDSCHSFIDSTGRLPHAHGDSPDSEAYHFDLTVNHGVQFVIQGTAAPPSNVMGMGTSSFNILGDKLFVPLANQGQKEYKSIPNTEEAIRQIKKHTSLLVPVVMKDGQKIYDIRRFSGGLARPTASNIHLQLSAAMLAELVQNEGYLVLYQHLGARAGNTLHKGHPISVPNQPPYFTELGFEAFQRLADEYHGGRIWVSSVANIISYHYIHSHLQWSVQQVGGRYCIDLMGIHDPFLQVERPLELFECEGLCFYTPDPAKTDIRLNGEKLQGVQPNISDYTGQPSLSITMRSYDEFFNL